MIQILSFIKSNWKVILLSVLVIALIWLYKSNQTLKADNKRQTENFEQAQKTNQVLNLTIDEYKLLRSKDKSKLDSVLAVLKIKPKYVKGATIINTVYIDTTKAKIIYLKPEKQPDFSFKIPFETNDGCFGVKGQILSKDQNSKIEITEQKTNNSVQLIVTKKRGILWWRKPEKYHGVTDCGEIQFTHINIIK